MYILAVFFSFGGAGVLLDPWTHVFGFVFTPDPLPDKSQGFLSPPGQPKHKRSPKTGSEDVTDILLSNQTDWF